MPAGCIRTIIDDHITKEPDDPDNVPHATSFMGPKPKVNDSGRYPVLRTRNRKPNNTHTSVHYVYFGNVINGTSLNTYINVLLQPY